MDSDKIVLLGCGDVGPIHAPTDVYVSLVKSTLATGDIKFAQAERVYSTRGAFQVNGLSHGRLKPDMASVFEECGFDVVSVAGNHAMDWGEEGLLDTIEALQKRGLQTVGAGRNLAEARRPAILERKGIRVAVLAYCSILNEGHEAGPDRAGVAPLRVHTYYEAIENQPGIPPRVVTVPYEQDLAGMREDIVAAKKVANVVVVSLHWGIHFIPRMIADYQPVVAEAAFASGADLILGHHAHVPKAVGVHSGKVCFYSLSNFIFTTRERSPERLEEFVKSYGVTLDPDYPRLAFGTDAKRSLIAKAVLSAQGVQRVSFLPVLIDKQLRPEVLKNEDPRFQASVKYMDWASEGFAHKFDIIGDEVMVT
ncbi:MAG TPA: CapA family protein [Burkholderiales bacterium]|nr:CapA family protein [Burkholderiales bacterium]